MTPWIVGIVAALGMLLFFWWLWSQPHPEKPVHSEEPVGAEESRDADADSYPPGSRPAGPGAETQRPDGRPSGGDGHPRPESPH
jgi:hypothetical protein